VRFAPPADFVRWRVGDVSGDAAAWVAGVVGEQCGSGAAATVEAVLSEVRRAQGELGEGPGVFGLIHADLHQENYLFHCGQVRAIDFDDCGWGHFAYDLAVTLSELRWRPEYPALRAGLLRGYRAVRPLPPEHERYLETFQGLRTLLLVLWFLELRGHPAVPAWEREVQLGLADLEAARGSARLVPVMAHHAPRPARFHDKGTFATIEARHPGERQGKAGCACRGASRHPTGFCNGI
jgi:Ser/Thr protein kinase RdoA (MazF antagonist)